MTLEWDEPKRLWTLIERRLDFAALHHYDWAAAVDLEDIRDDGGERRRVSIEYLDRRLIVVAYTIRNNHVRIKSMRKANQREVSRYGQTN
jgi:uncharacterized DUF497 family protein